MYLENMVNTAVRITELQSSDNHILVERFDINRLIGFSLFELDEKIRRKQIRFRNNIPADSFAVGETKLLKVGLLIIFDYFIERNEPNAVISIDFSHGNKSEVSIMVTDDGHILSDDEIEKAFNFFNIGSHSLSLAKQIAEAHEGFISIVSQHDKGICLTLSLFKTLNQIDSSE
jgi:two-component system, sensor histidine kinase and response regulator